MNIIKLLSISLFCLALISFGYGFHSIDLSYNMGRNAIDIGIDGTVRSTKDVYLRGLRLIISSEFLSLTSFLLLFGTKENEEYQEARGNKNETNKF